jgi:DNA-binding MarR family transcriptional regulator
MATTGKHQTKARLIEELGLAFRANQNAANAIDEAAADVLGLNLTDLHAMDIVQQHGRLTAGELAELSGLTTGAVTAVVDRLERMGYARRVRDEVDRRRVMVELTPKAEDAAWRIYGRLHLDWVEVLQRYTMDELRVMLDILRRGTEFGLATARRLREEDAGNR